MTSRQIHPWLIAPILGILGAVGPLAIDLYLPGMPQITAELGIGEGVVQFSLMTFLAGLMVGQLFLGPVSDRVGRRPMIIAGMLLFIAASLGCAFVQSGEQLLVLRFIQGLGASIGRAIGMAVIRDLYTGPTAAKLVGMMMLVLGLAPILGPLLGSAILMFASWRWIFVLLAVFGAGCIVMVLALMPETRLPEQRTSSHPIAALRNYGTLLFSRQYMPYVATMALAQAGIYAYLTGSSFVFINIHGLADAIQRDLRVQRGRADDRCPEWSALARSLQCRDHHPHRAGDLHARRGHAVVAGAGRRNECRAAVGAAVYHHHVDRVHPAAVWCDGPGSPRQDLRNGFGTDGGVSVRIRYDHGPGHRADCQRHGNPHGRDDRPGRHRRRGYGPLGVSQGRASD